MTTSEVKEHEIGNLTITVTHYLGKHSNEWRTDLNLIAYADHIAFDVDSARRVIDALNRAIKVAESYHVPASAPAPVPAPDTTATKPARDWQPVADALTKAGLPTIIVKVADVASAAVGTKVRKLTLDELSLLDDLTKPGVAVYSDGSIVLDSFIQVGKAGKGVLQTLYQMQYIDADRKITDLGRAALARR